MSKGSSEVVLRNYSERDFEAMLEIYNNEVVNSTSTFDIKPQSLSERQQWFSQHGSNYPLVAAELDGKVVGYCSISPFSKKKGYSPTVELSVYVHKDYRRNGIGEQLLLDMISRARNLGYHAIVSIIAQANKPSVNLHTKLGFEKVAHLHEVGYKFSTWQDVEYYEILL